MESTNVYFMGSVKSKAVKIGNSGNPESRLAEIQRGHPHKLVLYTVVDNVTIDYETELHKMFKDIRKEGEWFELTDELIHFMINRTVETSHDFKINNSIKNKTNIEDANVKIAESDKNGHGSRLESYREWNLRRELISHDKSLRSELESKGVHVSRSGGLWFFIDNQTDEKIIDLNHYIGPVTIVSEDTKYNWNEKWIIKTNVDSRKWENIKFTWGYSTINLSEEDNLTITTITTTDPGIEFPVVIYKGGVFDASFP